MHEDVSTCIKDDCNVEYSIRMYYFFQKKEAKSVVLLNSQKVSRPKPSAKRNYGGLGACPQETDRLQDSDNSAKGKTLFNFALLKNKD
jgi:hypothetical protein